MIKQQPLQKTESANSYLFLWYNVNKHLHQCLEGEKREGEVCLVAADLENWYEQYGLEQYGLKGLIRKEPHHFMKNILQSIV